ncbi:MAG: hypothetical protein CME62_01425 [Halobacteriovoraceae bacterium]|nr:hypothetical protein [Halobacteriovoraceae bacterium]|tara:strand:+ start:16610 stop:17389 length:780 start_codon:yes stop_codon:yes gene_type:complete
MKLFLLLCILHSQTWASFSEESGLWSYTEKNKSQLILTEADEKKIALLKQEISSQIKKNFSLNIVLSPQINAYATLDDSGNPKVNITYGMFSHNKMNNNVLKLLVCHELGHAFGGLPKQNRGNSELKSWSTAEGQADYYSILECAKKLQLEEVNKKFKQCGSHKSCHSLTQAALDLTSIYAEIKFWPYELEVHSPDLNTVHTTELVHPNPQCRLDTFIAAITCSNSKKILIEDSIFLTCEQEQYRQPSCWMAPNMFRDI